MAISSKQLDSDILRSMYHEFMSTQFPTLKSVEFVWPADAYPHDSSNLIKMDKGVNIVSSKIPAEAVLHFKNADKKTVKVYWDYDGVYNPDKPGKQEIFCSIPNGYYNPEKIAPKLIFDVALTEKLSLLNWYSSGAKVKDSAYNSCTTADELSVLTGYLITDMESAFSGAENLVSLPEALTIAPDVTELKIALAFKGCKALTNIPTFDSSTSTDWGESFSGCASLTDLSAIDMSNAVKMDSAFKDCAKLVKIPDLSQVKIKTMRHAFEGCKALPNELDGTINISNTSKESDIMDMFADTNVETITVRYDGETIPAYVCPYYFGNSVSTVKVVDADGNLRTTKTNADNPTEFKFLTGGEFSFRVPKNVSGKAKVAVLSGAEYSTRLNSNSVEFLDAKNNTSSINDANGTTLLSSLENVNVSGTEYVSWTDTAEKHGGAPAVFDAVWEDTTNGPLYCAGMIASYYNSRTKKTISGWRSLNNTLQQGEISLEPGKTYTVHVGAGSWAAKYSSIQGSGRIPNGYCLIKFE